MTVRIVLHIGPMKTGTEALSTRFAKAEALPASLIVPGARDWPQPRTDVIKHPEVRLIGTPHGEQWERRLSDIVEKARASSEPDTTVLLIAEAANSMAKPARLINTLTQLADSVDIVFFARDQRAALPSWLSQRVQSWTQPDFTRLTLDDVLGGKRRYFQYDDILARWSGPTHRTIPIPFFETDRKTDALAQRFTAATGVPVPASGAAAHTNESLGRDQLEQLGHLKQQLAWARTIPGLSALAGWLFYRRRSTFRSHPGTRWVLTTAERSRIAQHFAESNTKFRTVLGATARTAEWSRWFNALDDGATDKPVA